MDPSSTFRQMIQMNKFAFENIFQVMETSREQNEKMIKAFLDQAPQLPPEGKNAIQAWLSAWKTGCEDLKSRVDDGYRQMQEFFDQQSG